VFHSNNGGKKEQTQVSQIIFPENNFNKKYFSSKFIFLEIREAGFGKTKNKFIARTCVINTE